MPKGKYDRAPLKVAGGFVFHLDLSQDSVADLDDNDKS